MVPSRVLPGELFDAESPEPFAEIPTPRGLLIGDSTDEAEDNYDGEVFDEESSDESTGLGNDSISKFMELDPSPRFIDKHGGAATVATTDAVAETPEQISDLSILHLGSNPRLGSSDSSEISLLTDVGVSVGEGEDEDIDDDVAMACDWTANLTFAAVSDQALQAEDEADEVRDAASRRADTSACMVEEMKPKLCELHGRLRSLLKDSQADGHLNSVIDQLIQIRRLKFVGTLDPVKTLPPECWSSLHARFQRDTTAASTAVDQLLRNHTTPRLPFRSYYCQFVTSLPSEAWVSLHSQCLGSAVARFTSSTETLPMGLPCPLPDFRPYYRHAIKSIPLQAWSSLQDRFCHVVSAASTSTIKPIAVWEASPASFRAYYREVVMSLPPRTWNSLHRSFALEREQQVAATKLQRWQRGRIARCAVERERQRLKEEREAATKLQSFQRGRLARQAAAIKRERQQAEEMAAKKLQARQRGNITRHQVRLERQRLEQAATKIQSFQRGRLARGEVELERQRLEERQRAAVRLQALQRGKLARRRAELRRCAIRNEHAAATKLQALQKGRIARREAELHRCAIDKEHAAATKLQALQRGRIIRRKMAQQLRKVEEQLAATKMQSLQRGRIARQDANVRRRAREEYVAATKLQALKRIRIARQKAQAERRRRQEEMAAAIRLQAVQRGRIARQKAQAERRMRQEEQAAATRLQAVQRGRIVRREAAIEKRRWEEEVAATKLQSHQRGLIARQMAQSERRRKHEEQAAATKLQALQRGRIVRREAAMEKRRLEEEVAATKLQALQRGRVVRCEAAMEKRRLEEELAATKLQSHVRGRLAHQQAKVEKQRIETANAAATMLQSLLRGRIARHNVELKKRRREEEQAMVAKLQALRRASIARKEVEVRRQKMKSLAKDMQEAAAAKLQAAHRGRMARKRVYASQVIAEFVLRLYVAAASVAEQREKTRVIVNQELSQTEPNPWKEQNANIESQISAFLQSQSDSFRRSRDPLVEVPSKDGRTPRRSPRGRTLSISKRGELSERTFKDVRGGDQSRTSVGQVVVPPVPRPPVRIRQHASMPPDVARQYHNALEARAANEALTITSKAATTKPTALDADDTCSTRVAAGVDGPVGTCGIISVSEGFVGGAGLCDSGASMAPSSQPLPPETPRTSRPGVRRRWLVPEPTVVRAERAMMVTTKDSTPRPPLRAEQFRVDETSPSSPAATLTAQFSDTCTTLPRVTVTGPAVVGSTHSNVNEKTRGEDSSVLPKLPEADPAVAAVGAIAPTVPPSRTRRGRPVPHTNASTRPRCVLRFPSPCSGEGATTAQLDNDALLFSMKDSEASAPGLFASLKSTSCSSGLIQASSSSYGRKHRGWSHNWTVQNSIPMRCIAISKSRSTSPCSDDNSPHVESIEGSMGASPQGLSSGRRGRGGCDDTRGGAGGSVQLPPVKDRGLQRLTPVVVPKSGVLRKSRCC
eukprot:TRINITY_DN4014_c0_g1_i3.p1 TRINITY_DN4014_c0_g1~~TRINITY_DN4014_c0_g1_i3.p1  ORF type:complete len:1462 (-),score=261.38 TRINITY_DN4014_c0_g1_i3:9-4394(-)